MIQRFESTYWCEQALPPAAGQHEFVAETVRIIYGDCPRPPTPRASTPLPLPPPFVLASPRPPTPVPAPAPPVFSLSDAYSNQIAQAIFADLHDPGPPYVPCTDGWPEDAVRTVHNMKWQIEMLRDYLFNKRPLFY
jgi:hypothetical protein